MTEKEQSKWKIDPNHSEVQFKVKHLAISNVSGTFKIFNGVVTSDNKGFDNAETNFEIATNSIDTNNAETDNHVNRQPSLTSRNFLKYCSMGC